MGISKAWFGLILLVLVGCGEFQPLETDTFYPRDLFFTANSQNYVGTSTLPKASYYKFVIEPKETPELVVMRTCHREESFEKDEKTLWFIPLGSNKYQYTYRPISDIETDRVCPLRISAFDSDANQHRWAHIEFENSSIWDLNFVLTCGGETLIAKGVSVCQQRIGTIQRLRFQEEVRFATTKPRTCEDPVDKGNNTWEIKLSNKECLYQFYNRGDKAPRKFGRLTTIGFEGIRVNRKQ